MERTVLLKSYQLIRTDPWEFCTRCVRTKDEVDELQPVKAFPSDLEYLKLFVRCWQKYRYIAVPKSRRMFMSWICLILYLWDTAFHIGRFNAVVSKKEDDADALLQKMKFILENIDRSVIPEDLIPRWEYKFCQLSFPEIGSKLQAFPQGADQLRMHTLSGILMDEMAFWDKAQATYSASAPTIEGGGRITLISSPAPGFFKRVVFDQLDQLAGHGEAAS